MDEYLVEKIPVFLPQNSGKKTDEDIISFYKRFVYGLTILYQQKPTIVPWYPIISSILFEQKEVLIDNSDK